MTNYIIALFLGMGFGFSLNKAGLTKYNKIVNVFRFTDMAVLKFMMTALVVSMIGLYTFRGLGWITFPSIPRHLHRREPDWRADLRGGHGPHRLLTGHLRRRERRRQARLSHPRNAWLSGRCSDFRPDLPAGFPRHIENRQLWQCRHP